MATTTTAHAPAGAQSKGNGGAAVPVAATASSGGGGAPAKPRSLSTFASLASLRDQFDARVPADLTLSIVVIGASGDLAKKKTYPALFALFSKGFLPRAVQIVGYARTAMNAEDLRERLRPYLADAAAAAERTAADAAAAAALYGGASTAAAPAPPRRRGVDDFLALCSYVQGEYEPGAAGWDALAAELEDWEAQPRSPAGRLFYLALPPFVYPSVCAALRRCVRPAAGGTGASEQGSAAGGAGVPPPPLVPAGSAGGGAHASSAAAAAAAAASATFSPRRLNSGSGALPPLEDLRIASVLSVGSQGGLHAPRACDDLGPHPHPRSWVRVVVEKPFGRDLESSEELASALGELFGEDALYRIDHYLGKELSQNMLVMRFANPIFSAWWNRHYVSNVQITFKEDFGTQGRGGYFDSYGIIRDVIQNHLVQLLALVAMEPPVSGHPDDIRDEKCKVLRAIAPVSPRDCVLGQYTAGPKGAAGGQPGYLDDPTVPPGSNAPTFAACRLDIRNERWMGVPFILRAGKALNERSVTVRMQLRDAAVPAGFLGHNPTGGAGGGGGGGGGAFGCAAAATMAAAQHMRNEFVMRLQPGEAVYAKMVVKKPGLDMAAELSELDLSYSERYKGVAIPDAYERLILDCIRGDQQHFVRRDELRAAWAIFTPLLHSIDAGDVPPLPYAYGSRGPAAADELLARAGYVRTRGYVWRPPELMRPAGGAGDEGGGEDEEGKRLPGRL